VVHLLFQTHIAAYVISYVVSWITLGMFAGFLQVTRHMPNTVQTLVIAFSDLFAFLNFVVWIVCPQEFGMLLSNKQSPATRWTVAVRFNISFANFHKKFFFSSKELLVLENFAYFVSNFHVQFGWLALATSAIYAFVVTACSVKVGSTDSPCLYSVGPPVLIFSFQTFQIFFGSCDGLYVAKCQ
jgi:hypothetical protein